MSNTKRADVQTVRASSPGLGTERDLELQYADSKVIGNGSFGVVYRAVLVHNNEEVAIKKVLQDKRYKNRELQIMRRLEHRNVVKLKYFFYSAGEKKDELYLNLILEYVPDTVYRVARHYSKQRQIIPITYIRVYMYQLFRALGYIHSIGICHRDIKPQNLLLNVQTSVLKLCDFGSAKSLVPGEPNVAYICSRYYRAPELIFGATDYTTRIDVWSAGTVLAELLMGQPFFPGDSGVDQLVEIIKVLGTPSRDEIQQMNPNYKEFRFPTIRPHPWTRVFRARTPQDSIDLVSHLLKYNPEARLTPHQSMAHEFFNELRVAGIKLPSNAPMPPLFDFSDEELTNCDADLRERLLPRQPAPNAPQLPSTAATPNAAGEAAASGSQSASRKSSGAESIKHSNGSKQGSKSPARNAAAAPPPADSTSVTAINTAIQSQQQQQAALRKKSSVSSATGTPGGVGSILPEFGGNGNNNSSSAAVQSHQQPPSSQPPSQPQQQQPQASSATLHG